MGVVGVLSFAAIRGGTIKIVFAGAHRDAIEVFAPVVDPTFPIGGALGNFWGALLIRSADLGTGTFLVGGTLQRLGTSAVAKGQQRAKAQQGQ